MPIPWELAYQNQWLAFVRAFGARYDGNPALAYVCPTGFMQVNVMYFAAGQDETNVTNLALQAGYPTLSAAYVPAAETIIAAFAAAFPTTAIVLNPVQPFTTGGQGAVEDIRDFGFTTYPGQFGVMYPLQATLPPHLPPLPPYPYPKGSQMLCVASDAARLYVDPDPVPLPAAPIPLQDALENGVSLGSQYVEVYQSDLSLDIAQDVLAAEGIKLKANVPPLTDGCYPNFTTAEGCDALSSLTIGAGNTALGWWSLFLDTTGSFNTGVGPGVLILNNADSNTAVGALALLLNTSGTQNTAIGTDALVFNDSGSANTATGYFSLMNNTTGGSNTAIGWEALIANTTGNSNTAIGNQALQSSETTSDHVAIGSMAGSGITTANNNIIIGHHSGVHTVFGQESDRCFIDNIHGAPVSAATALVVMVDSDGRLGTTTADGPARVDFRPKAPGPKPFPTPPSKPCSMSKFRTCG